MEGERGRERPDDSSVPEPVIPLCLPNNELVSFLFSPTEVNRPIESFSIIHFTVLKRIGPLQSSNNRFFFFLRIILNRLPLLTGKSLSKIFHPQLFALSLFFYRLFLTFILALMDWKLFSYIPDLDPEHLNSGPDSCPCPLSFFSAEAAPSV